MYLPYKKRYFRRHQWNTICFRAQITQILLFSRMPVLERSKITVWEQHLSKKNFWYESFRYLSTLRKKDFQEHQWSAFFFRSQITHILMFSGMPVSERSKITVWEQQLSKNIFYYVRFMYVSTLQKKIFLAAPMEYFFL